jgi:predicted ArsR family transcriptional regulator
VTIGEIAKLTSISRNTIKEHVTALAEKGQLTRRGTGRGTGYALP